MVSVLKCMKCSHEEPVPMHCGKEMHVEEVAGKEMLVCWMGTGCGKRGIPEHCGLPMSVGN